MGLQAIYPGPRTSTSHPQHKKYPYLLRGLSITRPNQVWSADITYVPMPTGFMYLVAVMDWFSRFVLAWQLSNTLDGLFCLDALRLRLDARGNPTSSTPIRARSSPPTSSPANWKPLTSASAWMAVAARLTTSSSNACGAASSTKISTSKEYPTVPALERGLHDYFQLYNYERPHQSLDYRTPAHVHFGTQGNR